MAAMVTVNTALRFVLELAGILALAVWGYRTGSGDLRWALAILAPAVLIVFWALVAAPRATNRLSQPARLVAGSVALLISAVLLFTAGEPVAALILGAAIVINTVALLRAGG